MSDLTLFREEEQQEFDDMGSFNHSTVQANLAYLLKRIGKYTVSVELSLDSSTLDKNVFNVRDEMIPDVCIYPKRRLVSPFDILKMQDMPLMIIEVLSFRQFQSSLIEKFAAYFELGIKSCWLVDPVLRNVSVFRSLEEWHTFLLNEDVIDEKLDIRFPVAEIFSD